ncbi:MAG: hypothetical protein GY868_15390 [Deltaproteobacteria bacterium]|nr:hypothetical protein [Deltaproteobacteria bacterium]
MVTSSATIVDENGKIISLAQLKLPCSVKMNIVRRKEQVDPELGRLKVVEYGLLPSRAFTMKKKFERLPE